MKILYFANIQTKLKRILATIWIKVFLLLKRIKILDKRYCVYLKKKT